MRDSFAERPKKKRRTSAQKRAVLLNRQPVFPEMEPDVVWAVVTLDCETCAAQVQGEMPGAARSVLAHLLAHASGAATLTMEESRQKPSQEKRTTTCRVQVT